MSDYWFARYNLQPQGRGLRPLNAMGRLTIALFVAAMVGGGLGFIGLGLLNNFVLGAVIFALCAAAGGAFFIWAGATKSDPTRTVADYQREGLIK